MMMRTTPTYKFEKLNGLLDADREHPHIHATDMPYRIASTWQDLGCQVGIWERNSRVIAWSIFQPAWWNLDVVIDPVYSGSSLEQEIFTWGKEQMQVYANRTGEDFWGSVELFEDAPQAKQTIRNLEAIGFTPFDWSILRFELDSSREIHAVEQLQGYRIRPFRDEGEVQDYVALHRAAFDSEKMTADWRRRILKQPRYRAEVDLILENEEHSPVGFCICWLRDGIGQIEPLGVLPDQQGKGLGSALESAACRILREHGAQTIKVDHASYNVAAIALSQKTGFRRCHNALRYYVDIKCSG